MWHLHLEVRVGTFSAFNAAAISGRDFRSLRQASIRSITACLEFLPLAQGDEIPKDAANAPTQCEHRKKNAESAHVMWCDA